MHYNTEHINTATKTSSDIAVRKTINEFGVNENSTSMKHSSNVSINPQSVSRILSAFAYQTLQKSTDPLTRGKFFFKQLIKYTYIRVQEPFVNSHTDHKPLSIVSMQLQT